MKTQHELVEELAGTACHCGSKKKARQTFCRTCYFKLGWNMRMHLYDRIGQGYEEAYSEAVEYLGK